MSDYMIRATAADKQIRAFAITSRELTEEARKRHNSSPIVTAAMGRLMSGAVMMGSMMKGEKDLLTIQVKGDGPMRGLTVTADAKGNVKGYPYVPDVVLPANAMGKLDVGGAIGSGSMNVIKDMGLKEPYIGQIALQTGEIADDLTYYFAVSEQVPSSVGLGVLMSKENTVAQAGGFIIQLMPFTTDETIDKLEKKLAEVTSVTALLAQGYTPEMILDKLLGEFGLEITDKMPVQFHCDCSKERVEKAIASISKEELQSIIDDGEPIEVNCDFCNTKYKFDINELKEIIR
ncbi:MAG: Hsp33 family molecular chaperone HslO [Lachnospiraceae bacterium]|uniref:Hsp33 family molecular chaperone HslO n=1 Tax=Roseburia hominis TaxID=301301 RepID=UPI001F4861DB|nr:Hsp33 family molecular chaperone HslO [Roseburia hominis]MCI5713974.1 Hsp33 family molecular chaperone HslO [Lachnospiraceae bacterium]MDD6170527.1 Hsp33 family molecular chaperone HslO [Lachnospiraceae bacterium]MDY4839233.1 Hsp33 family molecular chaperone HslO [Lachnospiraceae bacterium]